jgi:hypothetical protein
MIVRLPTPSFSLEAPARCSLDPSGLPARKRGGFGRSKDYLRLGAILCASGESCAGPIRSPPRIGLLRLTAPRLAAFTPDNWNRRRRWWRLIDDRRWRWRRDRLWGAPREKRCGNYDRNHCRITQIRFPPRLRGSIDSPIWRRCQRHKKTNGLIYHNQLRPMLYL